MKIWNKYNINIDKKHKSKIQENYKENIMIYNKHK